jgi:CubicO group peptidase (beta-lactamase class C family)
MPRPQLLLLALCWSLLFLGEGFPTTAIDDPIPLLQSHWAHLKRLYLEHSSSSYSNSNPNQPFRLHSLSHPSPSQFSPFQHLVGVDVGVSNSRDLETPPPPHSYYNKRDPHYDPCPIHPEPVSQWAINKYSIPAPIKAALEVLDQEVQAALSRVKDSAVSLGVVYDQELIWSKGYGLVDPSDPTSNATADTIFRVGSITKLITDLALFQLRDAGKLVLDDPVQKYVPAFVMNSPYKNDGPITFRTLASQTSGLPGSVPCNMFTIWQPIFNDGCDITNEEAWRRLAAEPVIGPMYEMPHYADSAFAALGRALESVMDGQTFEQYVTKNIFAPLGMTSTFFKVPSEMGKRVPAGRAFNGSLPSFVYGVDLGWAAPTGQVYSSVRDMAKLASLFFQGKDSPTNPLNMRSSTLREMLLPVYVNADGSSAYGFPFEVYLSNKILGVPQQYWLRMKAGGMPGYTSLMTLIPELKLGLIAQMNNGYAFTYGGYMTQLLLPAFEQALWTLQPPPPNPGNLSAFTGTFVASEIFGAVTSTVIVEADMRNSMLRLTMMDTILNKQAANATWTGSGNVFRLQTDKGQPCLFVEAGMNGQFLYFHLDWWGKVYSLTIPGNDPYYGWVFVKKGSWLTTP